MEIFRIILNTHASLFSTLLVFASESIFEYGEIIINLINGIRLTHWAPAQHDIALIQDWILNECHTSIPSQGSSTYRPGPGRPNWTKSDVCRSRFKVV